MSQTVCPELQYTKDRNENINQVKTQPATMNQTVPWTPIYKGQECSERRHFSPKSGEKPYLEVRFRFGLCRDFINNNIQATISAFRLLKNMSIN